MTHYPELLMTHFDTRRIALGELPLAPESVNLSLPFAYSLWLPTLPYMPCPAQRAPHFFPLREKRSHSDFLCTASSNPRRLLHTFMRP